MNQIIELTFFSLQILTFSNVLGDRISQTKCDDYQSMEFPLISKKFNGSSHGAAPKKFPFMARIYNGNGAYSNGILISENFVLTIARNSTAENVILGDSDRWTLSGDTHSQRFEVIKEHQEYPTHTLKLLQLNNSVQFDEYVRPVCLRQSKSNISQKLIEIGWSETSDRDNKLLCAVKFNLISNTKCVEEMAPARATHSYSENCTRGIDTETHFCAAVKRSDRDVCVGLDGAALFNDDGMVSNFNEIVGIASTNTGCGKDYPHVFVRISKYISWIENIVWPNVDINASVTHYSSLSIVTDSSLISPSVPLSPNSPGVTAVKFSAGNRTVNITETTTKSPPKTSKDDEIRKTIFIVMLLIVFVLLCICGILVFHIKKYEMKNRRSIGVTC